MLAGKVRATGWHWRLASAGHSTGKMRRAYPRTGLPPSVILSEAKDLFGCERVQMPRFAQHDNMKPILG